MGEAVMCQHLLKNGYQKAEFGNVSNLFYLSGLFFVFHSVPSCQTSHKNTYVSTQCSAKDK